LIHQPSLRTVAIAVGAFAVALRLAFVFIAHDKSVAELEVEPYPKLFVEQDSTTYFMIAANLLDGRGYSKSAESPTAEVAFRRPPLYPLLIAGFQLVLGPEPEEVRYLGRSENDAATEIFFTPLSPAMTALNHVVGIATVVGTAVVVAWLTGSNLAGLLVGLAFAASLLKIVTDNVALPDGIVAGFALLGLALFLRSRGGAKLGDVALAGASLGLATWAKPVTLYVWPLFAVALVFFSTQPATRRLVAVVVLGASASLLPALWTLHNGQLGGVYAYSTQAGALTLQHRAAAAIAKRDGIPHAQAQRALESEALGAIRAEERRLGRAVTLPERDQLFGRLGLRIVAENPLAYARAHVEQLIEYPFWGPTGLLGRIYVGVAALLLLLSAFSLQQLLRSRRYEIAFLLVIVLLYLATASVPAPAPQWRYKAWSDPFLFVLTGFAVARLLEMSGVVPVSPPRLAELTGVGGAVDADHVQEER
jgi:4-amino-4-deoxy-L-arabinose transferase-like glycosyltransferase